MTLNSNLTIQLLILIQKNVYISLLFSIHFCGRIIFWHWLDSYSFFEFAIFCLLGFQKMTHHYGNCHADVIITCCICPI